MSNVRREEEEAKVNKEICAGFNFMILCLRVEEGGIHYLLIVWSLYS